MSTARIRPTDAVTALAGAVLLVSLFLDWYELPQGGVSGWGAFGVLDLLLAIVALLAISLPLVTAVRATPAWPVAVIIVTIALSFLTAFFLLYRLLDQPGLDRDVSASAGLWIGALAHLGVFVAAAHALRDERAPGLPEPTEIPVMPAPPRDAAGSSPTGTPA